MQHATVRRISSVCLIAAALLLPWVVLAATQVKFGTSHVESWLPADAPTRVGYRHFTEAFGDDQFLIVSWPACRVDDPRLSRLATAMDALAQSRPDLRIQAVQDSRSAVDDLLASDRNLTEPQALVELRGLAVGDDDTGFVTLKLGNAALEQRSELIERIEAAAEGLGLDREQLILAGEPYQVHVIDRSSRETMRYFVIPSSLLALGVAWICLKSLRLTCIVFAFAGAGQVIGLALISLFFGEMSAVMVVLPTLIFMLTLSAAVHLTNYYLDCGGSASRFAGEEALRIGARPVALATLTTVFGFGSLAVSQLEPVWRFGYLSALGLILSSGLLMSAFPAAVRLGAKAGHSSPAGPATRRGLFLRFHQAFTARWSTLISVVGIAVLAVSASGLPRLQTSTEFGDMFPADSRALNNLEWVQERLGPLNALEFLITFPQADEIDLLERVDAIRDASQALQGVSGVHSVVSATNFLPPIPQRSGTRGAIRRAVLRRTIAANFDSLVEQQVLSTTGPQETWRLTARIHDMRSGNYTQVRDQLLDAVRDALQELTSDAPHQPWVRVSGLRTVIETAHARLLADLGSSFAAAFLLITPVMMLIVRGLLSGLLLMIPNVIPVVLVFGMMGWMHISLDVASILTASVALGIAVDDTLHFLSWYLRCRQAGESSSDAVLAAVQACARPMLHTTLICTGSMLPFFFSDFLPTSKFALLMILILSGAIVGDLILLPAMLLSPLGNWIGKPRNQPGESSKSS